MSREDDARAAVARPWPPDTPRDELLIMYGPCWHCGGPMAPRMTEPSPGDFYSCGYCIDCGREMGV